MALMKLAKGIADGSVRMQLGDLERLIRLQDYLDGNPLKPEQMRDPKEIVAFLDEFLDALDLETKAGVVRLLDGGIESPAPGGTEKLSQTVPKTVL